MGEVRIRGGGLGWVGVSGLLQRVNTSPSVQVLSADHLHTSGRPRSTPSQPLPTPCVPVFDAGTQSPKPLGITGRPEPQWTQQGQAGHSRPPRATPRVRQGPPGGGAGRPEGMRNPFTFLDQNSHPRSTPAPPQPTLRPPFVHPWSPPSFHDAHLVNRGTQRLRKGVHRVSGCWSLGAGVSRPKPIGDYGYLWILILIHIRPNP